MTEPNMRWHCMRWLLQQHPKLQQMGASDVKVLLTTAATSGLDDDATVVAALPAAQQLDESAVAVLLMTSAKHQGRGAQALTQLPAAQQLQPEMLGALLATLRQHTEGQVCGICQSQSV